jgi:hypothetical protein
VREEARDCRPATNAAAVVDRDRRAARRELAEEMSNTSAVPFASILLGIAARLEVAAAAGVLPETWWSGSPPNRSG